MDIIEPRSAVEFAESLAQLNADGEPFCLEGNQSKRGMAGPVTPASVCLSTRELTRVLQYEPNDLTISVEAGMPFQHVQDLLARHGQMIALDPPFAPQATIGGVIATNSSGPMRCRYGTARDLVIGMAFATLEGKVATSGGMVVKNVAGLDMGKMLIGSFGTLAGIVSVNFRLHPVPEATETFLFRCHDLQAATEKRGDLGRGYLRPMCMDLLNAAAVAHIGVTGALVLAVRAGGSGSVLGRYRRELAGAEILSGAEDVQFWAKLREFTPEFLQRTAAGAVLRVSTRFTELEQVMPLASGAAVSRFANGVTYFYLDSAENAASILKVAASNAWSAAVEYAPDDFRAAHELWPISDSAPRQNAFAMMKRVKQMFDPRGCLNPGRLYGRL